MATIITQLDGGAALSGTADDDIIVAQHATGAGVPVSQVLTGGSGDDIIFGDHNEIFVDDSTAMGNATRATALSIDAAQFWGLHENPDVANATTVPSTAILAQGDGNFDVYSVLVGAGETITIDLDYGWADSGIAAFDSSVALQDSSGATLVSNAQSSAQNGALGSFSATSNDAFLSHTNSTGAAQTLFIRVGDNPSGGVPLGATYMLNVSVTNHAMANTSAFGDDDIDGGSGNDVLYGLAGDDLIQGGVGNDIIVGGSGADTVNGGAGDDQLWLGTRAANLVVGDSFDGGAGFDRLIVASFDPLNRTYDLRASTIADTESIRFVTGTESAGDLIVQMDILQAIIAGLSSIDANGARAAGSAYDTQFFMSGATFVDLSGLSFSGGYGSVSDDRVTIVGDDDAETIKGTAIADVITGGGGNDRLQGGIGADTLDGGTGTDTASYDGSTVGVIVNLATGAASGGDAEGDTLVSIENLSGSDFDDVLMGDAGDNEVTGGTGNDTLNGLGGADVLRGQDGNDTLMLGDVPDHLSAGDVFDGGVGFDTLQAGIASGASSRVFDMRSADLIELDRLAFYSDAVGFKGDVTVELDMADVIGAGFNTIGVDNRDGSDAFRVEVFTNGVASVDLSTLTISDGFGSTTGDGVTVNGTAGVETIRGSTVSDLIFANAGDDSVVLTNGADQIELGAGNDVFIIEDAIKTVPSGTTVDGGTGTDAVVVAASGISDLRNASFSNLELLEFAAQANKQRVVQVTFDQILELGTINANQSANGSDRLEIYHDTLSDIDLSGLTFIDWGTGSGIQTDTIRIIDSVSTPGQTIVGTEQNDEFIANGDDTLIGGAGDDVFILRNGANFDNLDGGTGTDTASYTSETFDGLLIDLDAGSVNVAGALFGKTLSGIENVVGGALDDTITGDGRDNVLEGGDGNDTLAGGGGNDTLNGGAGVDTVTYADSGGRVAVFLWRAPADLGGGQGTDTFISIENVIGTDFNDRLVGDSADNLLSGGLGNDVLIGLAGNDTLEGGDGDDELIGSGGNDILRGGNGADTLDGLGGADTLEGGSGDDRIFAGLGVDTVNGNAGNDLIFGNFGQDILLGGLGDDDIRAGGSADILEGGDGRDKLVGGNGKDVLWGGAGNDVLTGGNGTGGGDGLRDVFVFKSAANGGGGFDQIRDFEDTKDKLDLSQSGYTNFAEVFADASQVGANVEINFDFAGILRINNFLLADFTAGDVLF